MQPERVLPGPGQESVWDYPRPPRLEAEARRVTVIFNGITVADTKAALRVLETSHPPVYYIPPADVRREYLVNAPGGSLCEWKGAARFYGLAAGDQMVERAAWYYPKPAHTFSALRDHVAFYAGPMVACFLGREQVIPQPGGFYGGWITRDVVGPFKGIPGSQGW